MENEIINFITGYISLTAEEVNIIKEQNLIKSYKKGTVLLSEGEFATECYFVLKGCIRSYYLIDGEEKTTEFYTENQSIRPVSYITNQPSEYYLACLEDCVVAIGSTERNKRLIEKLPRLESMIMQMNGDLLVQNQVSFDNFKHLSPEMRYLKLLETRADLFDRVPLYHLATYLGITAVSLSRMRKRISKSSTD
ncbi:Crp/Fnr family transcriptional regulator [Pontibacter burrus]|uniref:Crp/Fnr family transcriptional regulator n=1 Tax=Pontibacter burrus TaxID=2704466 RepID=A0A6B3LW32_9BACT|nr:Crp/Fnr family transcriptional regulator [Pontibacter burrus]NEM98506.1 Crp/Fnr family transcriptional regulator [Pontibacter burrus]